MPLVTFILLTYNSERWIETAMRSVINQTHQDMQILVIDDGSEDRSVEKVLSFNDSRIELYKKEHSGISSSLNFTIKKVKGDFIAKLGSDDYCDKERISKQLKFFSENKSYGIVGSNFVLVNEAGKKIDKIRNPQKHDNIVEQLPRRCCIWDGSILMRIEIVHQLNGYDEGIKAGEDWDFFLRAIGLTRFHNIQEFLSTKRIHPGCISFSEIAFTDTKEILLSYNNSIIQDSNDKKKIAKAYFDIGYYYYYENDFRKANEYFYYSLSNGNLNVQFFRYFLFSKYLGSLIRFYRKYKLYKLFNILRYFDNGNKYLRNKF